MQYAHSSNPARMSGGFQIVGAHVLMTAVFKVLSPVLHVGQKLPSPHSVVWLLAHLHHICFLHFLTAKKYLVITL